MEDPPNRNSPPDLGHDLSAELLKVLVPWADSYKDLNADILNAVEQWPTTIVANIDSEALFKAAEGINKAHLEMRRSLPSDEDFWVDAFRFSVTAMPYGLGLSPEEFWSMSYREWFAQFRIWKFYNPDKSVQGTKKVKKPKTVRIGYRAEVQKWMDANDIKTVPDAARWLGVSHAVLKSIRSNRGKPRHGSDALKMVLGKIRPKN